MKKILFVLLFVISSFSFAQTKYLIYFKDKGINSLEKISESSEVYKQAVSSLSERAIERRKKVMGDNFIQFEDLPINKKYLDGIENMGIKIQNQLKWFNAVSAYLTDEQLKQVADLNYVDKVEKVMTIYTGNNNESMKTRETIKKENKVNTSIDYGSSHTQLALSNVPLVHKAGIDGHGVIIGLLDTGFRWRSHESLSEADVLKEYDYVFHDSVTANQSGDDPGQDMHGTYVFSIVGGYKPGKIIGSAYGAKFILAKTEDIRSETHVEEDNYAAALEWMEALGVDITSSSLGYNIFDAGQQSYTYKNMNGNTAIVTKAANLAFDRGVVTVTAAGNEGNTSWHFIGAPADAFNIITVGAVSSKNTIAPFSSRGPTSDGRIKPDIVTQGMSVFGADVDLGSNSYQFESGTSAATPIASGITALLLSAYPYLSNVQVLNIVHMSGDNWANPDTLRGYGLLFADRALEYPNIEEASTGNFVLHKAFLDTLGVQPGTAKVFISTNDSVFTSLDLVHDNSVFYKVGLTGYNNNQKIKLYFTFTDQGGRQFRQPETGNYELQYGTKNIFTDVGNSINNGPTGYALQQNYPNPFNNSTVIEFDAPQKASAQIIIYDILGQQVKQYNLIAVAGKNFIKWNAESDRGTVNSSGVYFYILKIAGNSFSKKMILLK